MEQVIVGRYALGEPLGAGGMARVVEGHDARLDRRVAVKLLPADRIDPVGRERFRREARSSAGFSHPNAVATFDAGEADGYLYLVMELVDGPSLADRLARSGALDVDEAVRIADSILAALGAAHAAGIVHRDVKPGNVLLDNRGAVKLADFGIARRLDDLSSDLTGTGLFIGTPKYLAPEQAAGEAATPASDLYATAVVLYEMLAGAAPYGGPTPMATALAHQTAPIPDPAGCPAGRARGSRRRGAPGHGQGSGRSLPHRRRHAGGAGGRAAAGDHCGRHAAPSHRRARSAGRIAVATSALVAGAGRRSPGHRRGGCRLRPARRRDRRRIDGAADIGAGSRRHCRTDGGGHRATDCPTGDGAADHAEPDRCARPADGRRADRAARGLPRHVWRACGRPAPGAEQDRRRQPQRCPAVPAGCSTAPPSGSTRASSTRALLPVLETLLGPLVATIDEDGGGNGNDD